MTCQEFWTREDRDSSSHLQECAMCAAAWEREQALLLGLRVVQSGRRAVEAPARLEGRLIAAFQGHAGLGSDGAMRRRAWMPVVTWFSAAAAVATLAALLVREPAPKPVRRAAPNAMHLAEASAVAEVETAPVSQTAALDEDFITLPDAGEFDAGEEMNLVRLEFPRSAMLALGFEVSEDSAGDPVAADVMIGPDGVARAVRFLEE